MSLSMTHSAGAFIYIRWHKGQQVQKRAEVQTEAPYNREKERKKNKLQQDKN